MTLHQTAIQRTVFFVLGTVAIGIVGSWAWMSAPEITSIVVLATLFGACVLGYYRVTLRQLEREAQEIQDRLRG